MPIARFAGKILRDKTTRDKAENGPDSLVMDDQQQGGLMRDLGFLMNINPIGAAKWVFEPRSTRAGTLDEARKMGLIP